MQISAFKITSLVILAAAALSGLYVMTRTLHGDEKVVEMVEEEVVEEEVVEGEVVEEVVEDETEEKTEGVLVEEPEVTEPAIMEPLEPRVRETLEPAVTETSEEVKEPAVTTATTDEDREELNWATERFRRFFTAPTDDELANS